jgi:hypothetical protein
MNPIVRRTLIGFVSGAVAFGAASIYQAVSSGVGLGQTLGPLGFMMLLGGTIGGLAGPLVGEAVSRSRQRRRQRKK